MLVLRFVCLVALAAAAASSVIDVTLSLPTQSIDAMSVDITLTNPLDESIRVLNRYSPLVFDRKNTYRVEDLTTNSDVVYDGRVVKYGPVEDNFGIINFAPRESITFPVNFASAYRFEENHVYRVTLDESVFIRAVKGDFAAQEFDLTFAPTTFTFGSVHSSPKVNNATRVHSSKAQVQFNSCSSSQESTFTSTVLPNAHTELAASATYFSKDCREYYVTWFGTYSSSRYSTVKNNLDAVDKALSNAFQLNCSPSQCSPGVFAYVYPSDRSHEINVCATYFRASTGLWKTDSQPGTIIHECSHFNDVAGTDDIQYGSSGAQNLAKSSPSQAIQNADSYEYFNEFHPQC